MKFDIDSFGDIMDDFLKDNHIQMLVDMPEGSQEVDVSNNTNLGPTVDFFILLKALKTTFLNFKDLLDDNMLEQFIDTLLAMIKEEILKDGDKQND